MYKYICIRCIVTDNYSKEKWPIFTTAYDYSTILNSTELQYMIIEYR